MDTPDFFIGARLASARANAGISLEKAAKDTRIRVARLREIESDDFSGFAHPIYARLFLLDYAEYLGIPSEEIRPILPDRTGPAGGGFQYIDALAADLPGKAASPRSRRRRLVAFLLTLTAFFVLASIVLYTYVTLQKIERVAGSKSLGDLAGETTDAPQTSEPTPAEPVAEPVATIVEESVAFDLATPPVDVPTVEVLMEGTLDLTVAPATSEALPPLLERPATAPSVEPSESPAP